MFTLSYYPLELPFVVSVNIYVHIVGVLICQGLFGKRYDVGVIGAKMIMCICHVLIWCFSKTKFVVSLYFQIPFASSFPTSCDAVNSVFVVVLNLKDVTSVLTIIFMEL